MPVHHVGYIHHANPSVQQQLCVLTCQPTSLRFDRWWCLCMRLRLLLMQPVIVILTITVTEHNEYTHVPFNGLFSRATWVSRYQKGKTSLDLNGTRDDGVWDGSGISWTIGPMQTICTSLQTDNHTNTSSLFLTPKQQSQSTEGKIMKTQWHTSAICLSLPV